MHFTKCILSATFHSTSLIQNFTADKIPGIYRITKDPQNEDENMIKVIFDLDNILMFYGEHLLLVNQA